MSKSKPCPSCGKEIHPKAKVCPFCETQLRRGGLGLPIAIVGILVVGGYALLDESDTSSGTSPSTVEQSSASAPVVEEPIERELDAQQAAFITAVRKGAEAANAAENDMQKGSALATRNEAICEVLQGTEEVSNWIGEVLQVGANNDGNGVLEIEIASKIEVGTWNNAISDAMHGTLIPPGTSVFDTAAGLRRGDIVEFSGEFFTDATACIAVRNFGLSGKVSDPKFVFRFTKIEKAR